MVKRIRKNCRHQLIYQIFRTRFYGNSDSKGKTLKGMTIGLAMNSVYYYQKEKMARLIVKSK